jgi:hypothetical protein
VYSKHSYLKDQHRGYRKGVKSRNTLGDIRVLAARELSGLRISSLAG